MENKILKKAQAVLWIVLIIVIVIIVIGVFFFMGMKGNSSTNNLSATTVSPNISTESVLKTSNTNLGNILVDNSGMTLYIFEVDSPNVSNCYGTCASFWPPFIITAGYMPIGDSVNGILGVFTRTDGTNQVTINEMPLYTFVKDINPGDINGQGVNASGGLWYVVSPSGEVITTSPSPTPSPSSNYYGSGSSSGNSGSSGSSGSSSSGGYSGGGY